METPSKEKTIFRYNLDDNIVEMITKFSKLHMFSTREVFKEKWKTWLLENSKEIEIEKQRLKKIGYNKNVDDKMYTAARYYFKKKTDKIEKTDREINNSNNTNEKNIKTKDRGYIVLDNKLVIKMDLYIRENYSRDFKPSTSFTDFIELNKETIDKEIKRLLSIEVGSLDTSSKCKEKIKKTYKNRCYIYQNK